jgi:hypothetical protein
MPDFEAGFRFVAPVAGNHRFRILKQHGFRTDRRRRRRQCGKDILSAAQAEHVADDVRAVERVHRAAPGLIEHAYRWTVLVLRFQAGQLLTLFRGTLRSLFFGAHQPAETENALRDVVQLVRLAVEKRDAQFADVFQLSLGISVQPDH